MSPRPSWFEIINESLDNLLFMAAVATISFVVYLVLFWRS